MKVCKYDSWLLYGAISSCSLNVHLLLVGNFCVTCSCNFHRHTDV